MAGAHPAHDLEECHRQALSLQLHEGVGGARRLMPTDTVGIEDGTEAMIGRERESVHLHQYDEWCCENARSGVPIVVLMQHD